MVLDAGVLIGYLHAGDAHHRESVALLRDLVTADNPPLLLASMIMRAETLVGPARVARADEAIEALTTLGIRFTPVTDVIADRAALIRGAHGVGLPDAFVLATAQDAAIAAETTTSAFASAGSERGNVTVATFDTKLRRATRELGFEVAP